MIVLFDTNVVLDLLLAREPFVAEAQQLFSAVERGEMIGFLGATTITTIHYLATKQLGAKQAHKAMVMLLKLFDIAPVNRVVLTNALNTKLPDFEDAVLHHAALLIDANAIVSRDKKGFSKSSLAVYTPMELLDYLLAAKK
jgi:predicted nucleic acid-binding protein